MHGRLTVLDCGEWQAVHICALHFNHIYVFYPSYCGPGRKTIVHSVYMFCALQECILPWIIFYSGREIELIFTR